MKQVIILDVNPQPGTTVIRYAMWFAVPVGKENPAVAHSAFTRATATELNDIALGKVVEAVDVAKFPSSQSQATVQAFLQTLWTDMNAAFQASPKPGQFFGLNWDGAAWTQA